jgi:hypothetical protein
VRRAWRMWPWPELLITEERAFRTIWSNTKEFFRAGSNGKPDELFYIPDMLYYRVKADALDDPLAGTLPSDNDYFETFSPVDSYIALDQICRRPIGLVFGVYAGNPRLNGYCTGLGYKPSENGIDILGSNGPTVFIKYQLPAPRFSAVPYANGKAYKAGDAVFYTPTGECYIALSDNTGIDPTFSAWWRVVQLPEIIAESVIAGAFAGGLRETDASEDAAHTQMKLAQASIAEAEAEECLAREIDVLLAQGERYFYMDVRHGRGYRGYCASEPWSGGTVTTLTDICETDPTYPPTPVAHNVTWEYHPEIISILIPGGAPSLQALTTVHRVVLSRVELNISPNSWVLKAGTADPLDPGHVVPVDFTAVSNIKYWEAKT